MRKVSRADETYELNYRNATPVNDEVKTASVVTAKEEEGGTFKPPAGVQSAARKALKWIEEGKAGDGFTSVGRGRASQLASGKAVSLAVVKKMHAYFSRHIVDKKGKDWDKPSAGKVAWYAWGGDAGASWAKGIAEKHQDGKKKEKKASFNSRYAVTYDGSYTLDEYKDAVIKSGIDEDNYVFARMNPKVTHDQVMDAHKAGIDIDQYGRARDIATHDEVKEAHKMGMDIGDYGVLRSVATHNELKKCHQAGNDIYNYFENRLYP